MVRRAGNAIPGAKVVLMDTSQQGFSASRGGGFPVELAIRGRDIAIDPRTWSVVPVSGGAQHGLAFNDWGDRFSSSNSDDCS